MVGRTYSSKSFASGEQKCTIARIPGEEGGQGSSKIKPGAEPAQGPTHRGAPLPKSAEYRGYDTQLVKAKSSNVQLCRIPFESTPFCSWYKTKGIRLVS